jgi:hypothetical protein
MVLNTGCAKQGPMESPAASERDSMLLSVRDFVGKWEGDLIVVDIKPSGDAVVTFQAIIADRNLVAHSTEFTQLRKRGVRFTIEIDHIEWSAELINDKTMRLTAPENAPVTPKVFELSKKQTAYTSCANLLSAQSQIDPPPSKR